MSLEEGFARAYSSPDVDPLGNIFRIGREENHRQYIAELQNPDCWAVPEPPELDSTTCAVQAIRLQGGSSQKLDDVIAKPPHELCFTEADDLLGYRASLVFEIGHDARLMAYELKKLPVFMALSCCPGPAAAHEVHRRNQVRYRENICSVQELDKRAAPGDFHDVLVVNATGPEAEVVESLVRPARYERRRSARWGTLLCMCVSSGE